MASSSTNPYPNYPYPSEFNVSDLVPDKLSKSNYSEWKPLMLDFIESRGMNEFIKDIEDFNDPKKDIEDPYFDDYKERSWRKSDGLVRTWILSTLDKDIVKQVLPHKTAREVWMALETMFGSRKAQQPDSSSYIEIDRRLGNYMPLHINAIQGDIQSAKEFIHDEPEAIRMPISTEGETMLITAVRSVRRNELVAYLPGELSAKDLAQRDNLGRTALHEAAEVGNLEAAKMLVEHNSSLPNIEDENGQTPLLYAAKAGNREMVLFLLNNAEGSGVLETGPIPSTILYHLANSGLYDIALKLLQQNSMLACTDTSMSTGTETSPLMAMSQKRSSFLSGTPLNSFHKFIYSIAPAKLRNNATKNPAVNENRQHPPAVTDIENSVVDENLQSGAVNPVVNENQQNPLAVTENSIVNENLQNAAVNPAVNENRQNSPAVTDTENFIVDENPQSGAVNPIVNENQQNPLAVTENSIVNENLQNAAVNPAVNENRQNPPAITDTENSIVDENPQSGAVNPVVNENQQNPLAVTEKSIVNEDLQNVAPVKLKNTATENPTEHRRGNTENSANRENHVENLQSPVDTENLANTENPVENLQNYTDNPANRENSNPESPQNLPQNLVVNENPHNDAVNPVVNENRQNLPAITDTENSVVDENPQNVAVNPIVNENRQNPLAIADNSMVNENLQNPPAVTDTENSVVDENPQYGAVTENPPIIENNLQNPVNIADSENPQNCTITENLTVTENPIVNENPQIINENSQNLIVTDNSIVNENPQIRIDITEDSVVNENLQNLTVYETPHNDIDNPQNPVNNDNVVKIGNRWNLVVDGIRRSHAILWYLADEVPANKHVREIREIKLKHHEALELVKCLCKEIAKLDFSTATWIFTPALAQATSSDIHEIVEEILRSYPAAISFKNENNQSIFQSAIVWRRENVFNLIYQLKECSHKFLSVPDRFGNIALHLAGCLGPQQHLSVRVSAAGAALQMQRELQWFKVIFPEPNKNK